MILQASRPLQRMADAKARKAVVVAVRGDPFASALDGQRGEERIRYQVAFDVGHSAQPTEDVPMTRPRGDHRAVRLLTEFLDEGEGISHQTVRIEDLRMSHDTEETAEDGIGQAIGLVGIDEVLEPREIGAMVPSVFAMGIHKHVDIKKNHEVLP